MTYKELTEKWDSYIDKGWYGFDGLGSPVPESWIDLIDETLDKIVGIDPSFGIHQIKLKFGGIRMYLRSDNELVHKLSDHVENTCYDPALVY
jgi:hypothetical protein